MDFQKLTLKSQEAIATAQELARRAGNPELTPDHLTLALLEQELPRTLVDRAGYGAATLLAEAEARVGQLPTVSGGGAQPQASARLSRVLDAAFDEMRELGDEFVSVEHLLLALDGVPREAVKVGTHFRIKGLEFKGVFLPFLGEQDFPRPQAQGQLESEYLEDRSRAIGQLFVAMTRARDGLFLLCSRNPSDVVAEALDSFELLEV